MPAMLTLPQLILDTTAEDVDSLIHDRELLHTLEMLLESREDALVFCAALEMLITALGDMPNRSPTDPEPASRHRPRRRAVKRG
jgi:hypothetical protein